MTCQHPVREQIPWYVNGTLDAKTRTSVEAHLETCADCRRLATGLQTLAAGLALRPTVAVPSAQALLARLPDRRPVIAPRPRLTWQWVWLLLRAQARVVRQEIWAASALVMALVTLTTSGPGASEGALPLMLIAPVVAAMGVAFLYGPMVDPALEIELVVPASPRLVLLARLALVFCFDLGLGLGGSIILTWLQPGLSFWPFVMTWLAPMTCLSSLAFLLAVLSTDAELGGLGSLVLWVMWHVLRSDGLGELSWRLPDVFSVAARPWLWSLALLFGALALWLGGREEHWLRVRA